MNLQLVYEPSVNNAPLEFQQALNLIVAYLDAAIPNPATITITVGYGTIHGQPVTSCLKVLGDSIPVTYSQLTAALPGQLQGIDPTGGGDFYLKEAQAVLFGLAPVGGNDGFIGFNTNFQWSYTHTDDPGRFDFVAAALHEITEVLGRTSLVSNGVYTQYDMFRFNADGSLDIHGTTPAFFSIDGGKTLLNQFSLTGDDGDWAASSVPNDAFTAQVQVGHKLTFSEIDQLAIDTLFNTHRTLEVFANQPGSIALAVENEMYGVIGTQGEVELLATQFLPPQLAHAQQLGFNTTAYGTEALGLVFAFGNETGSHAFQNNYGPSVIPNNAAGDHQFADLAAHQVFGAATTPNTVDVVSTWVSNWKAFFTTYGISGIPNPTADQIDLAARGTALGDAVGVALDNNINGIHDLTNNFLGVASHGTGVYSAPLALQPEYNPLLMVLGTR